METSTRSRPAREGPLRAAPTAERLVAPRLGHVGALDGVRGLAVALVVAHHLQLPGVHGGWLGVDLFFALSGFLITLSVLGEPHGLAAFWRRRAWRLGPAMGVLLAWYLVASIGAPDEAMRLEWLGAAGAQVLNVTMAGSEHGPFSPHLGHLWSLSAEVQFYLVWPVVLAVLLRRRARPATLVAVAAGGLAGSVLLRTVLAADGMQWNRLYFGPDTRAGALFAGCLVGLLVAWGVADRHRVVRPLLAVATVPAALALAVLVAMPSMDFVLPTPHRWGLTAVTLAGGVVVAAAATVRGGLLRPVLELAPLQWLGRISYSVYLWHVPVIAVLVARQPDISTGAKTAVVVPLSLLLGWVSYAFVERPLLSSGARARLRARLVG